MNTFDSRISEYAENRFERDHIHVITNARVERIEPGKVIYKVKPKGSDEPVLQTLPYGLCLWSTGIGKVAHIHKVEKEKSYYSLAMTPFAKKVTEKLKAQEHKRVLTTDGFLHLQGVEDCSIFALGDCASIDNPSLMENIMEIFKEGDT